MGAKAGVAQFPQLEMAGSWSISQVTATRRVAEAARFAEALPRTSSMLTSGELLEQACSPGPWAPTSSPRRSCSTCTCRCRPCSTCRVSPGRWCTTARSAPSVRLLRPRSWRRVLVDSRNGRPNALDDRPTPVDPDPERARDQVLDVLQPDEVADADEPQHDPSARLARVVDVRDVRCCGPGCSTSRTHRDHREPHPSGPTSARSLGRLSARCHRAGHAGWTLERHGDGSVTWTSPLGRAYDQPSPHAPPPQVDLHAELPPLRPRPSRPQDVDEPDPGAEVAVRDQADRDDHRLAPGGATRQPPTADGADDAGPGLRQPPPATAADAPGDPPPF